MTVAKAVRSFSDATGQLSVGVGEMLVKLGAPDAKGFVKVMKQDGRTGLVPKAVLGET
jgi:hypothetical protein